VTDPFAVVPGDGAYDAVCSTRWSAPNGPNGGYLAALLVRAVEAEVADPAYALRSLTCHYLRPPADGPVRIVVEPLRKGRTVAALRARLEQDGRRCVEALASLTTLGDAPSWEPEAPDVPGPGAIEPWPVSDEMPPIAQRLELRPAVGPMPFSGADEATSGGWMRIREHEGPVDAAVVALLADAWLPAAFPRLTAPAAAPTIDLTIHFRRAAAPPGDQVLGIFRSVLSAEGLFEEDGELWSQDGRLLAQSRQLALLR
jgi:acyl-CoA thioesterase